MKFFMFPIAIQLHWSDEIDQKWNITKLLNILIQSNLFKRSNFQVISQFIHVKDISKVNLSYEKSIEMQIRLRSEVNFAHAYPEITCLPEVGSISRNSGSLITDEILSSMVTNKLLFRCCLVCPMLPVTLDSPFCIVPSFLSIVYLVTLTTYHIGLECIKQNAISIWYMKIF